MNNIEECAKSELDLFSVPPTQTSVIESSWDCIYPHPNFKNATQIRFDIAGSNSHYLNLAETELHMKCSITGGTAGIGATDKISVVNNFMHSLFEQVQVYINNTPVENTNKLYQYKAYLENLLCYGKEAKETLLYNEGWVKDTAGKFDSLNLPVGDNVRKSIIKQDSAKDVTVTTDNDYNEGFFLRHQRFSEQKVVQLCGKLHCDIFNTNRYMLNNVNIQIVLLKANAPFYLLAAENDATAALLTCTIDEIFLKMRRCTISPSIMLAHAMALEKTTAKYPIKRVLMKDIVIPYSASKFVLQGVHTGVMPTRIVFGFLNNSATSGQLKLNPFNFQHLNLTQLLVKVANQLIPYQKSLNFAYNTPHKYGNSTAIEGYNSLFKNIREAPNDITFDDYCQGNTLYAFDLTPDQCSSHHYSLLKEGSLDIEFTFKNDIKDSTSILFYMEFDNIIEITKERNVIFDFKI